MENESDEVCWLNEDCIAGPHTHRVQCRFPSWQDDAAEPGATAGEHVCDSGYFDRTLCAEPCGSMHSYCDTCGRRADPCAHEPDTGDVETQVEAMLRIQREYEAAEAAEPDVGGLTADERAVIRGADNLYRGVERVIAERLRATREAMQAKMDRLHEDVATSIARAESAEAAYRAMFRQFEAMRDDRDRLRDGVEALVAGGAALVRADELRALLADRSAR